LKFKGGFTANLFGGFDGAASSGACLIGSQGSLHINQPTHPYEDSVYTLRTPTATEQVKLHNGVRAFTPALNSFHDCLLNHTPTPVSNDDPIKNLRVMEAAKRSAENSKTISLDINQ
jgi:predicted dehydrogenase